MCKCLFDYRPTRELEFSEHYGPEPDAKRVHAIAEMRGDYCRDCLAEILRNKINYLGRQK
ncbi:hypothetical protein HYS94_01735 [Candidatus Daviesbacteria bacterium]|nr:hypothetical protein [Candidatus Daviesbacteria bacterium]